MMVSMKCTIFLRIIFIVWQACCYAFTPRNTASPITFALNNGISTTDIPGGDIEIKKSRLVWLTGHEDLRLHDHGGFNNALKMAAERDEIVIPVFIIDTKVHLRSQSHVALRRLHHCLSSLESDILSLSLASPLLSQLVVRTGSSSWVLPALAQETNAVACHCVADDVVSSMRSMQRSACEHLIEMEIDVLRWSTTIRPDDSFRNSAKQTMLPSYFPDYCQIVNKLPTIRPDDSFHNVLPKCDSGVNQISIKTDGIPTSYELIRMAEAVTPVSVLDASKQQHCNTYEPYEEITSERWLTEKGAKKALEEYCNNGNDEFTDKYFISSDAANIGSDSKSMYASSVARILKNHMPSDVLAQREGPTRAFSPALSLGALSSREVLDTARNRSPVTPPILWWDGKADSHRTSDDDNNRAGLYPSDSSVWGRSSEGCLSDVIEWREWYFLLAQRSLALQERGEPATSGAERIKPNQNAGDPREFGHVNYWRFKNQYLVRYLTWSAGKDYYTQAEETRIPALLLVHGFAASAEQYERLVYSIRQQTIKSNNGKDVTPPIFAMDLLGFGHAEKPGLTFTQYLWESQIIDFAVEVMEATPMVMVGNSIGGGLAAGAASSLGGICRGLVLCNTAGILIDPEAYEGYPIDENGMDMKRSINSHTEAAFEGNPNEPPYSPVPILGNKVLDTFGLSIVSLIYPQIEERLSAIYGNNIMNADAAVTYAIQQSASSPGSPNIIGSGQKLAPNRPLNEVLFSDGNEHGFPVLVLNGMNDMVSSPEVAKKRAELFSKLSKLHPEKIKVEKLYNAGHCPHDEAPDKCADAMLKWFDSSFQNTVATPEATL